MRKHLLGRHTDANLAHRGFGHPGIDAAEIGVVLVDLLGCHAGRQRQRAARLVLVVIEESCFAVGERCGKPIEEMLPTGLTQKGSIYEIDELVVDKLQAVLHPTLPPNSPNPAEYHAE